MDVKQHTAPRRYNPVRVAKNLARVFIDDEKYVPSGLREQAREALRREVRALGLPDFVREGLETGVQQDGVQESLEPNQQAEDVVKLIEDARLRLRDVLVYWHRVPVDTTAGIDEFYRPVDPLKKQEVEFLRMRIKYLTFLGKLLDGIRRMERPSSKKVAALREQLLTSAMEDHVFTHASSGLMESVPLHQNGGTLVA